MARWRTLAISAATALLIVMAWWSIDALLTPSTPSLGPLIVVTPQGSHIPGGSQNTHSEMPLPSTPAEPNATVVEPASPPPAGDDDDTDSDVDNDDDDLGADYDD